MFFEKFESFVGVNFFTMIFAWANLLILYLVLRKILFHPIKNMIDSRQKEIDDMYDSAEKDRTEAEAMRKDYEQRLESAAAESEEMLRAAQRKALLKEEEILKEAEAQAAGADYVGLDEYVEKIKGGWTDVDVIICTPNVMGKVGALGRILGPRGLMPNPKTGTVTMDIAKAVTEVKAGKIDFKVDKYGIIHTSVGKISFTPEQIIDNAKEVVNTIIKLKPSAAKGTYVLSIYLSTTMSPGLQVDPKSVETK